MPNKTFTPADFDMTKERDWSHGIGMMDWDETQILFTKRSLMDFLKYVGVTVDPNFSAISKLPRYAHFGKLSGDANDDGQEPASQVESETAPEDDFRPSRRVRTAPGGESSGIFEEETTQPALWNAPPLVPENATTVAPTPPPQKPSDEEESNQSNYRPTRRVRTAPGGKDSLSNWWTDEPPAEEFKPTRKVREIPGGQDNIKSIF